MVLFGWYVYGCEDCWVVLSDMVFVDCGLVSCYEFGVFRESWGYEFFNIVIRD